MDDGLRASLLGFLDVEEPVVIRMRHEPTPASARLLVFLGAGWIVDAVHGDACVKHCGHPVCSHEAREEVLMEAAHTAMNTMDCKIPNCTQDAVARLGKYAGLCSEHIQERRRASESNGVRPVAGAAPTRSTATATEGFAAKVARLGKAGKEVDKIRAEAKRLAERALAAKARADTAEREFKQLARELMGDSGA